MADGTGHRGRLQKLEPNGAAVMVVASPTLSLQALRSGLLASAVLWLLLLVLWLAA
ncbi:hypothetical protein [Aureimonas jatrophae]|uniref:Uncharacterized protein n=1 Tax=Aureimonas jatrophae TaxID=1166073 RepID=A0A1H0HI39_9HYPH|nr:hypothetical protein [Aureimonas jatrophae]MBB3950603.1 hypothetical protein [Aureimonas jatrophae]SDO18855.1 hypothetical protein SAMN05192530_104111 [Aureimonas jatrophae]